MENDVVQLEGQVKELLDPANLLANVTVHLTLVSFLLATVEHKHVVKLLVFGLAHLFSNRVLVRLSLRYQVVLLQGLVLVLFHFQGLLLDEGLHRGVEDVLVHLLHVVDQVVVDSGHLDFAVVIEQLKVVVNGHPRQVVLARGVDRAIVI